MLLLKNGIIFPKHPGVKWNFTTTRRWVLFLGGLSIKLVGRLGMACSQKEWQLKERITETSVVRASRFVDEAIRP